VRRFQGYALGKFVDAMPARKASRLESQVSVPQTDTGGLVENTKADERTFLKELGKLTP
jgi:hypothetical protein